MASPCQVAAAQRHRRSRVAWRAQRFAAALAAVTLVTSSACGVDDVLLRTCTTGNDCAAEQRCVFRAAGVGQCMWPDDAPASRPAIPTALTDTDAPRPHLRDDGPALAPELPGDVGARLRARPLALPLSGATASSPTSRFTLRPFFPRRDSP